MWTFRQATGRIEHDGELVATGYAGMPPLGKNNPAMQNVRDIGPLPQGLYTIGDNRDDPKMGHFVMPLRPDPANRMFGRAGFYIHGDSAAHPGAASEGCIVTDLTTRMRIAASADRELTVVAS
jgi:type VI secretion system (T6SS) effector TldE1-like protein